MVREGLRPPVLIFVQSVERAMQLFHALVYDGLRADVLHAERTVAKREVTVSKFRTGQVWVLIATELVARGMDFKGVLLVLDAQAQAGGQGRAPVARGGALRASRSQSARARRRRRTR